MKGIDEGQEVVKVNRAIAVKVIFGIIVRIALSRSKYSDKL